MLLLLSWGPNPPLDDGNHLHRTLNLSKGVLEGDYSLIKGKFGSS